MRRRNELSSNVMYFGNVKLNVFVWEIFVLENMKSVEVIAMESRFKYRICYINMQIDERVYESKLYSLTEH
jgi:hypothetical protein